MISENNSKNSNKNKRLSILYKKLGIKNNNRKMEDESNNGNKSNSTIEPEKASRLSYLQMLKHTPNRCIRGCSSYYGCCCSKGGKKLAFIFGDSPPRHTYLSLPEFAKLAKANPIYHEYTLLNQNIPHEEEEIKKELGNEVGKKKIFKNFLKKYHFKEKKIEKVSENILHKSEEKNSLRERNLSNSSTFQDCENNKIDNISLKNHRRHSVASVKECHLMNTSTRKNLCENKYHLLFDSEKLDKPYILENKNKRVSLTPNILLPTTENISTEEICNNPIKIFTSSESFNKGMNISKNEKKSNKYCRNKKLFTATPSSLSLFSNGYLSDAFSSVTANFSGGSGNSDVGHSRGSSIIVDLPTLSNVSKDDNPRKKNSVTNRLRKLSKAFFNSQNPGKLDLMNDWEIGGTQNAWVCPSDRHLQLRAQLKSGWSVRTAKIKSPTSSKAQPSGITEEEQEQIKRVLERAEQGRVNEQIRIGKMVERLENLKARATGNGVTQCLLCSAEFGLFTSKSYAAMCNDCRKYVCQRSCGVDTFDQKKMEPIFLCKVCSEYREVMLKKSGAWFYKELPTFVRSSPSVEEQEPSFLKYTNKTNDLNKRKLQSPSSCINNNGRMDKNSFQNKGNKQFSQTSESIIGSIPNFVKDNPYRPRIQPSWIKEKPVGNSSFNSEATHTSSDSEPDERQGYLKKISRRQYRPKDFLQKQSYIPDSLSQNLSTIGKHSKGGINKGKNQHRTYDSDDSDNDYCHHSTPSTSPRLSLATPSSFGGDDFSQNPTTIVSNDYPLDTKSIDSGGEPSIVQSDHSNHQSNTLSSSISGAEFQRFTSPSISQNELRHSNSSIRKESYNSPERRNSKGSSYPIVTLPQQSDNGTYILPSLTNNLQQTNYSYKCSSSPKTSISYGGNGIPKYSYNFQQRSLSATPGRQSPKNYFNNCNNNNNQNTIPTIPPRPPSTPSINLTYANNIRSSSTSSSTSSLSQRTCNEGNTFFDNILSSNNNSLFTLDPVIEVKGSSAVTPNDIPSSIEEIAKENATTPVFMSDQEGEDVLGSVQFELTYYAKEKKLVIHLISARNLKAMDSNGFSDPYVKFHLIPGNIKATKLTSKTIEKTLNPNWDEELVYYGVTEKEKQIKTLRITVLDRDRIGSDFLGEVRVLLRKLPNGVTQKFNLYLDSAMRSNALHEMTTEPLIRGKILIAICYNFSQGSLIVNIKRCSELIGMDSSGFSDPYCKITLTPVTNKNHRKKTSVKKKTLNPEFDETFNFVIPYKDLPTKALVVKVYDHDVAKHDDYIGGIVLSTAAEGERGLQWKNCLENANQFFEQWHELEKED